MSAKYIKRFEAVFLCSHPKGPKMSYKSAAKYLHRSVGFVKKWVARYTTNSNIDDLPGRGLKRGTLCRQDKVIINLFKRKPTLTLKQAQQILSKRNIKVSIMTIHRRLRENNINWQSVIAKPLLSERHVSKRLLWARKNLERDWNNIIFSDEASFYGFMYKRKAWTVKGEKMVQRTVKHPVKVHVWGCVSLYGFGKLHLFTTNLNSNGMLQIYKKCLLPSAEQWFGSDKSLWVLQEDNDPKHRSRRCVSWKEENDVHVLDWPSQSPDANPIENVWAFIKQKLQGRPVLTLKSLSREIRKVWRSLPVEYAQKLIQSMPTRCEAIMNNNGDWTPY